MKLIFIMLLTLTANGCAILSGAKDALSTAHEIGKVRGRAEVLQEIQLNKKKLRELKNILIIGLSKAMSDGIKKEGLKELVPVLTATILLLKERGELLEALRTAHTDSSE